MRLSLFALVIVATLASGIRAIKVYGVLDQLSLEDRRSAEHLTFAFDKIDEYLQIIKANSSEAAIENIKSKYLAKNLNPIDRLKPELVRKRKALGLFTRLSKALNSCDYESYKALAMNQLAIDASNSAPGNRKQSLEVLKDCTLKHARLCRPKYEKIYVKLSSKANQVSLPLVILIFDDLLSDEGCLGNPLGFSGPEPPKLTRECVKKLAGKLFPLSETGQLTFDNLVAITGRFNEIAEDHMIKPCRDFHRHYREVFAPAIYDATVEDSEQEEFLYPKEGHFGKGLRYFRACEVVLRHEKDIKQLLVSELSDMYQPKKLH